MTNDSESNTPQKIWKIPVIDSEDGSGDGIIIIPDELLVLNGWIEGDSLTVEIIGKSIKLFKE
jgi:hypothetical protein